MTNLYNKIKELRKKAGMSQEDLAKKTGYTDRSSIAKVESGLVDITQSKIMLFAKALGVTPQYLMRENDSENIDVPLPTQEPVTDILIYGALSCGTGLFVDDAIIGHISVPISMLPNKSAEYFAQYASGDSMIGAGIESGDLLVFEKTQQLDNGQIGTFCIDDNIATCKKFSRVGGNIYLLPANDSFEPIPVTPDNACFRVVGVLALKISKKQL